MGVCAGVEAADGKRRRESRLPEGPKPLLVVEGADSRSKWLPWVIGARDAGEPLRKYMRERGMNQAAISSAHRLQARLKRRGQTLAVTDTRGLLAGLRAEVVDRITRRVGVGTGRLVADVDTLRAIDATLRQAEAWEREKRGAGAGAPAAPGAAVRGARGARNGAMGARGGGKAGAEGVVSAINGGEAGCGAGNCAVEAAGGAVEALSEGLGVGQGGESGAAGIGPLAGC